MKKNQGNFCQAYERNGDRERRWQRFVGVHSSAKGELFCFMGFFAS
jgi:hypothetical protein